MHSKWDRRVIPKWRASRISATLPEAKPLRERNARLLRPPFDPNEVASLVKEWNEKPVLGIAADLLNFSHIPEALPLIADVAKRISEQKYSIPRPLLLVANRVLGLLDETEDQLVEGSPLKREFHYKNISELKQKLSIDPRNAIALVDMGRIYAALGQDTKARDVVLLATALCPNHRFVLRSATRLLIHIGKADRALHLLSKATQVLDDPWLLAPMLSTTTILEKPQKHLRRARTLFSSAALHPMHLSELGSAIATIQMLNGDTKIARKTFSAALVAPNDNTVAQAMWASEHFSIPITAREEWFNNQFSCEARYYQLHANADFEGAMKAAFHWFIDEPFSTRPMKAASFVSGILGEYVKSEEFALEGLRLDKDDLELQNNLIFALASQNKIESAVARLQDVIHTERRLYGDLTGHSLANIGMLLYRTGEHREAEISYRKAIAYFQKSSSDYSKALASAYMARESLLAMAPNATELVLEATETNKSGASSAGQRVLNVLKGAEFTEQKEKLNMKHSEVVYDRARNTLIVKKTQPF